MARERRSIYEELPDIKIDLNFRKVIAIIVTLSLSFALPAYLITNYKQSTNLPQGAQVAGASTSRNSIINIPILNIKADLNSQSGILIVAGLLLIGISLILIIYLIVDNQKQKKFS